MRPGSHLPPVVAAATGDETPLVQVNYSGGTAVVPVTVQQPQVLPISLDTVFRLAADQNGQIRLAREKLNAAYATQEMARKAWLPELYAGVRYDHHEGGIQDEDGRMFRSSFGSFFGGVQVMGRVDLQNAAFQRIDAERKMWQRRGDVSRLTSETLLDAAETYVDLLAATTGAAISNDQEKHLEKLLQLAQKQEKIDPGVKVETIRVRTQLLGHRRITQKLRKAARAAAARLAHLLGLPPDAELVSVESQLAPVRFVEGDLRVGDLIAQAMKNGPGIQELEGLLSLIHQGQERAKGIGAFLPILETRTTTGGFGAGPGSQLDWENRWDMTVRASWKISNLFVAREQQRIAQSQRQQAYLSHQYLQSRLALGVRASYEESVSSAKRIKLGKKQIDNATSAYRLSSSRFVNNIKGASASEVLLSLQALALARLDNLDAVRDFNKAQLRLLILTGAGRKTK